MPQFVRNPKTGEVGYWDGEKITPLPGESQNQVVQDIRGAPKVNVNIDPSKPGAAADAERIRQLLDMARNPAQRSAELGADREAAIAASQDPQYLADKRQEGREGQPLLAKAVAAYAIPALISGGTSLGANAVIRGGGMLARLLRMSAGGVGGYAGEKANQALGLSEGGEGSATISALLGAAPQFFRPAQKLATADDRRLARLAAGETVAGEARTARGTADTLYRAARNGADVNPDRLLGPLDDAIMREMNTPNFNENIVDRMMGLRDSLDKYLISIGRRPAPTASGVKAAASGVEDATIIPTAVAKRNAAGVPQEKNSVWDAINSVFSGLRGQDGANAGRQRMQTTIDVTRQPASAENLVDDLKQLQKMAKDAERLGRTDLAVSLRRTYESMAGEVPGLTAADEVYAQSQGLKRGARAVRSNGAVGAANVLDDPKLSGGLTTAQRAFLRQQAAQGDRIGRITQAMLDNPLGRALLRRGVRPDGTLMPSAWSAAMQIGARMAGLGGVPEGDQEEPTAAGY